MLSGVPGADGTFALQVAVTDSAAIPATVVSVNLPVHVTAAGSVSVATSSLPVATVGLPYKGQLASAGGTPPVTWTLLDVQRLPGAPGDPGADLQATLPSGLTLEVATGQIFGTPLMSGSFVLLLQVTDSSVPAVSATDNVLLQVAAGDGLRILNSFLPDGTVGAPYAVTFGTSAIDTKSVVFSPVDTAGHDSPAARASVPPGLTLTPGGQLGGTPTLAGSFTFMVEAVDDQNRIAIQAFNVVVAQKHAGCMTAPGATGWLLIGLGVMGLWRRRRR